MFFITAILGVCFFICIVNYSFQKSKYKYYTEAEMKKYNVLNSPNAWLTYSFIAAISVAFMLLVAFIDVNVGFTSLSQATTSATAQSTDSNIDGTANGN